LLTKSQHHAMWPILLFFDVNSVNITFPSFKSTIFRGDQILQHVLNFFFYNPWYSGQLTRITTNPRIHWTPCKPSRQVRHRGGDRRTRWDLNPRCIGRKTLPRSLGYQPRCCLNFFKCTGNNYYFLKYFLYKNI